MYRVFKHSQIEYNVDKPYCFDITDNITEKNIDENNDENNITENYEDKLLTIENQAFEIINNATKEAEEIINNAKIKSEQLLKEKEHEGYKTGMDKANKQYLDALEEMEVIMKNLIEQYDNQLKAVEDDVLELAIALSKKVFHTELEKDNEIMQATLKNIMNKYKDENNVVIETSLNNILKFQTLEAKNENILKANKELSDSQIIINTDHGTIDASIDRQFENLQNSLLNV